MSDKTRTQQIAAARNAAIMILCRNHSQELRDISREIYAERGIEVRTRKTKQERLDEEIAEAKKLLIENGLL